MRRCAVCPPPLRSPTTPHSKSRSRPCVSPSPSNVRSSKPRPDFSRPSRRSWRRSRSNSASRRSPAQEVPEGDPSPTIGPTVTVRRRQFVDFVSRQCAARRRHVRRVARRAADNRFPPWLGRRCSESRKHGRARFQRRFLFPPGALRRRRHHGARLQLPAAAGARRLRHRRSDAHQRRLDRVHRLLRRSPSSSAPSHRPPTWTTAPLPKTSAFIERASASELSRTLGGADGRIGLGVKANGERWMSSLHSPRARSTTRKYSTRRLAAVARAGFLAGHRIAITTCTSVSRVPTCSRPPTRARARRRAIRCASATGPRSASTACGSSTPAPSTPTSPASTAWSSARNWKSLYSAGRALLVRRRSAVPRQTFPIRTSTATTCRAAGCSPARAAATTRPRVHSRIRAPWCRSPAVAASVHGSWRRASAA